MSRLAAATAEIGLPVPQTLAEPASLPPAGAGPLLRVDDIGQYLYCPRTIHFLLVRPVGVATSVLADAGRALHATLSRRPGHWQRRLENSPAFARFRRRDGVWRVQVQLSSQRLGLTGRVDLLYETSRFLVPVELKLTHRPEGNLPPAAYRWQLAAYTLLLEEALGRPAGYGVVYLVPQHRLLVIRMGDHDRKMVLRLLQAIRALAIHERIPSPGVPVARCRACDYLRYCGDVERPTRRLWVQGRGAEHVFSQPG